MRTLGEILRAARLDKGLSLDDIAKKTKIEIRHLKALEADDYATLPHPAFTKGFIRSYAKAVAKPPEDLVALYRRDNHSSTTPPKPAPPTSHSVSLGFLPHISRSHLVLLLAALIVFISYLGFQYRALLVPPPLSISQPKNKAVLTSPITLEGQTSIDALITLDPDITIKPDSVGHFITQLVLAPGDHQLKVTATNRFGRNQVKTLNLTILSH